MIAEHIVYIHVPCDLGFVLVLLPSTRALPEQLKETLEYVRLVAQTYFEQCCLMLVLFLLHDLVLDLACVSFE